MTSSVYIFLKIHDKYKYFSGTALDYRVLATCSVSETGDLNKNEIPACNV